MSLTRVLQTAAATLTRRFYLDATLTDCTGSVSVTVTRLDGTVVAGPTTATHLDIGVYTYVLPGGPAAPASATWQLDLLRVAWTGTLGGALVTVTDDVEVVGGFLFGLAEARASDPALSSSSAYPDAMLAARRVEVEQDCEEICQQAFVPRFRRLKLHGQGTDRVVLPDLNIRALRLAQVSYVTGQTPVTLTGSDLSGIQAGDGLLVWGFGRVWPRGFGNIVVEYEHGLDAPPERIRTAAMLHLRTLLVSRASGIPDRAGSYTAPDGGTYRPAATGRKKIGIPEVDGVYERYMCELPGIA